MILLVRTSLANAPLPLIAWWQVRNMTWNTPSFLLLLVCEIFVLFLWCLCAGYRHVYLEGMEEASVFVHVAVNDITGKVGKIEFTEEMKLFSSVVYGQNVTCVFWWLIYSSLWMPTCGIRCKRAVSSLLRFLVWKVNFFFIIFILSTVSVHFLYWIYCWNCSHHTSFAVTLLFQSVAMFYNISSLHFLFLSCGLRALIYLGLSTLSVILSDFSCFPVCFCDFSGPLFF